MQKSVMILLIGIMILVVCAAKSKIILNDLDLAMAELHCPRYCNHEYPEITQIINLFKHHSQRYYTQYYFGEFIKKMRDGYAKNGEDEKASMLAVYESCLEACRGRDYIG